MPPIYLDHNATSSLDPMVFHAMEPWLKGIPANASSIHSFGQDARRAIDRARVQVGALIGAQPEEITFTSGGTEANNLAVFGTFDASKQTRRLILCSAVEHQSVLNPCLHIEQTGGSLSRLSVDRDGRLDADTALSSIRSNVALITVMLANNDIGTLQPVGDLSDRARECGVLLHTDAVQAAGKIPVDVNSLGVDLLSFSAHKLRGPQGVGALFVREGTRLSPMVFGGHQERSLRPGTENVAAIVGFGKACEIAADRLEQDASRLFKMRSLFEAEIVRRIPGATVNGPGAERLPCTSNISFDGLDGELLTINLDLLGLAVSTGAACSASDHEPSHVLIAMGRTKTEARSSVRISFGPDNTDDDAATAVERFVTAVQGMREGFR
jgi:cysteine desulfurase